MSIAINIIIATESLVMKRLVAFHKVNPYDQTFFRFLVYGIATVIFSSIYYPLFKFDYELFLYGFGGTLLLVLSKLCFSIALKTGETGPVQATMNTFLVIFLTIGSALWNMRLLRVFEIIGLIICLMGGIILTNGDRVVKLITCHMCR